MTFTNSAHSTSLGGLCRVMVMLMVMVMVMVMVRVGVRVRVKARVRVEIRVRVRVRYNKRRWERVFWWAFKGYVGVLWAFLLPCLQSCLV